MVLVSKILPNIQETVNLHYVHHRYTHLNAFHAAGECRRQVKNVTKYVKNVEIVDIHDHM